MTWTQNLVRDSLYCWRMVRKTPGFSVIIVLMLAVGIGMNTALFSVVNGILLSTLPYPQAKRLYAINEVIPQWTSFAPVLPVNSGNFLLWKDRCPGFSEMAAILVYPYNFTGVGLPQQVYVASVSPNMFSLLGVEPQIGKSFSNSGNLNDGTQEVILTHEFWKNSFYSAPNILGKAVSLNRSSYTVVGILPSSFKFPEMFGHAPQMFIPLGLRGDDLVPGIGNFNYTVIARLKSGVTVKQGTVELNVVEDEIARKGDTVRGVAPGELKLYATLTPLKAAIVSDAQRALWILMAAAGLVLFIICANLANLMLVRNAGRSHEVAIRVALGASRGRLMQQMLTEAFLLSAAGTTLGFLFAFSGLNVLVRNAPFGIPRMDNLRIDPLVLWFTLIISVIATLFFALLPSLRVSAIAPLEVQRSSGSTIKKDERVTRLYSGLVISEIAMCCMLLIAALLLVESLTRVIRANRWMEAEHVLAVNLSTPFYQYNNALERYRFYSNVSRKIQEFRGVRNAAWTSKLPILGKGWGDNINFQEITQTVGQAPIGEFRFVSPEYFAAIGIPLVRGREFWQGDEGQDVAVVSQSVEQKLLRGRNAIGMHLIWQGKARRVVGVVGNVRTAADSQTALIVYLPLWSFNEPDETLVVRTSIGPVAAADEIRSAIWSVNSQIAIPKVELLKTIVQTSIAPRTYVTSLSALFACFAVLLAVLGLYGVISYTVRRSTQEIGVRIALGAQSTDILRLILGRGVKLALIGVGIGTLMGLFLTRLLGSLLFGISATDPLTFTSVVILLVFVAVLACYIPARRAMRIEPMVALRYE
ncbi:MAG TPA: ABC transporter permease [Terriglobales bacterium]|nr:ABC transporter permease [Terriglobales bacterium]